MPSLAPNTGDPGLKLMLFFSPGPPPSSSGTLLFRTTLGSAFCTPFTNHFIKPMRAPNGLCWSLLFNNQTPAGERGRPPEPNPAIPQITACLPTVTPSRRAERIPGSHLLRHRVKTPVICPGVDGAGETRQRSPREFHSPRHHADTGADFPGGCAVCTWRNAIKQTRVS